MRKPLYIFMLIHFLFTTPHISTGLKAIPDQVNISKSNHSYSADSNHHNNDDQHRGRRSLDDEEEDKPFWANRGKRFVSDPKIESDLEISKEMLPFADENPLRYVDKNLRHEAPFWGNRGRRDSKESLEEVDITDFPSKDRRKLFACYFLNKMLLRDQENNMCSYARLFVQNYKPGYITKSDLTSKERRDEEVNPFWGNRGRRASEEISDEDSEENPFWGNRGRRYNDPPFWGARGRREEDTPFWGARGRREEDTPFWGARGRREEDTPFWGARGRREEDTPFWGARGRREEDTPFWGARGRKHDKARIPGTSIEKVNINSIWDSQEKTSGEDITDNLLDALKNIKSELKGMTRFKRSTTGLVPYNLGITEINEKRSFWKERGRQSELQYLFNDKQRSKTRANRLALFKSTASNAPDFANMKTLRQDRLYAEQPYYIIVDRSSRSVGEVRDKDDPYFISRGKKKVTIIDFAKAARDRRGILEQLAKTMPKDPYYAVRGKKDGTEVDNILKSNPRMKARFEELTRARELICSAIMLMNRKKEDRNKRDLSDRDRNRRAILKELAAHLQNDPYFVSRGKKSLDLDVDESKLEDFVRQVNDMCR